MRRRPRRRENGGAPFSKRLRRQFFTNFLQNFWKFFGNFLAIFWAPWAPQGPQNGPRDPGDRFKIEFVFDVFGKIGPEVSTIFEILIFGFLGVFFNGNLTFFDFSLFFHPWGPMGPPLGPHTGGPGGGAPRQGKSDKEFVGPKGIAPSE